MYWLLVRRALFRRKVRLVLTEMSLVTAFFLFAMLQGLNVSFQHAMTGDKADRLMVMNKNAAAGQGLPIAYRGSIGRLAGVSGVTPVVSMQTYFQDRQHHVETFAVDPAVVFSVYPEWQTGADQLAAMKANRRGAIVGVKTARRYGWHVGQTVPLVSDRWFRRDGSPVWPVEIVGLYQDVRTGTTDINVLMNIDYLWEGRAGGAPSDVDLFIAGVRQSDSLVKVSSLIDDQFANSAAETESQTEQAFGMATLRRLGDLNLFVRYIVSSMFFALLFVTSLTISQSAKARSGELAALQAMGFRPARIARLIWGEALVMCGIGAILGMVFPRFEAYTGVKSIPISVLAEAAGIACVVASLIVVFPIRALLSTDVSQSLSERVAV
jgi:putative ABC transport system permease protein